ncbi:iron-siderophore ABC transporter substrate-binding protein [Nesterenkonia sp. F]|uniref:iron-siderophore ABC transporter substrate-binding protein n=1 Tax=Nesterenkonia sp. F TaxID=795955 RepID=UPI000255C97A|nr:iron-siderophore ABC transporter substrate-binding protein [Nesterenkonia sp. F]
MPTSTRPTPHPTLRRATPAVAVASLAALTLSACGGNSSAADESSGEITIEHALGTAQIEGDPERVVALGQGSAETAIALGVTPVGKQEYPWGADDSGYLPWIHEAVQANGDELPELFTGGEEMDVEAIVDLEPDVILAPWTGIDQEQYDVLSDIAPTVAYEEEPWTVTWDGQIETVAEALGKEDQAEDLIEEIEAQFEEASRPEWEDITYSYIYNDGPGTLGVFYPSEQRAAMVDKLGLTPDPVTESEQLKEYDVEGTDSAMIGLENADMLSDSDLIFTFYSDAETRKEIESQDLYQSIPAVERGSVVAPEDPSLVTASSMINPLTVPWVLERYIPMIEEAVAELDQD